MTHDHEQIVRFVVADFYGLWRAGDLADDLGWESDHPDAPRIRLLRLHRTGEVIALTDPIKCGLCVHVDDQGRTVLSIPLEQLVVNTAYRRELTGFGGWNGRLSRPLRVALRPDGTYVILDGHMRYKAAKDAGITHLECEIDSPEPLTLEEEARRFMDLNRSRPS